MIERHNAFHNLPPDRGREPVIACSPGKQPLWRYLVATCEHTDRGEAIGGCRLLSWPEPGAVVNSFISGDVDAIGLIGATFMRLRGRVKDSLTMFQPITWMTRGPVLCARGEMASLMDLKGLQVASPPLASDLMAYWRSLVFHNYGHSLNELLKLRPRARPGELLKEGTVHAAFVSGYTWRELRGEGFSVVTDMRKEWDRATGGRRIPVMGGLVGRGAWLEENHGLREEIYARLGEGLKLCRTDRDAFLQFIASWDGISPELAMDEDEASYWCRYWGIDEISEDRLVFSGEDERELSLLECLMRRVKCI